MSIKTWNGLLELNMGGQIDAQILFDEADGSLLIHEMRTIGIIPGKMERDIYRDVNPFEISVFSALRAMMALVKE